MGAILPVSGLSGQRVYREDKDGRQKTGTIVEATGVTIKVKWDTGRTSYYGPLVPGDIRIVATSE